MAISALIQKHFGKIAVGTGLGLSGVLQYFPKIGKRDKPKINDHSNNFIFRRNCKK